MSIDQHTLINQLERASGNARELEQLYRQTLVTDDAATFRAALVQHIAERPNDVLLSAWACRLDLPLAHTIAARCDKTIRHWRTAISASAALGLLFVVLADGRPPVPAPGPAAPSFWIGWAPLTALAVLFYLASFDSFGKNIRPYILAISTLALLAFAALSTSATRTDDVAILVALHLPFLAWATVGAALAYRYLSPAKQGYAFIAKSLETALTGAIYAAAGMLFLALSYGIFAALGVELAHHTHLRIAACGIGTVPILALASAYDPTLAPAAQSWATGLGRLLAIFSRVFLALSLGVLLTYLLFFVPANFWHPFHAREALIAYNTTIETQGPLVRRSVIVLVVLTLVLNAYALAAIASRIDQFGLSPNRYAAAGWNSVTLAVLTMILIRQGRCQRDQWLLALRTSIAYSLVPATAWALWVCLVFPQYFPLVGK
jgi:hypothetical protein